MPSAKLPTECDLLVVGSGAGGLSAAFTAATLGLRVVVLEKEPQVGGTTAWSGGWMWVPHNPLAVAAGIIEPPAAPLAYLRALLGAQFNSELAQAYLTHAAAMVRFYQERSALRFLDGNTMPDFYGHADGARQGGRSVCAAPFDGRTLGAELHRLRPPLDLLTFRGMGIGGGADLRHFLRAWRALDSFIYVARRLLRHSRDVLLHGRGAVLMGGNALAGALFKSALDQGVQVFTEHPATALCVEGGRVVGAEVATPDGPQTVRAGRGVVLAAGGFPHDVARKKQLFPHAPSGREHWSAAPLANTGDGIRLAEAAGAAVQLGVDAGAWAPVSLVPRAGAAEGSVTAFPHLVERGKPGLIAVLQSGQRFANEARNYHSLMRELFKAVPAGQPVQAWLVVDHRFQRRFGLGHSKPWPFPLGGWLKSGYLKRGRTLPELARACGIDVDGLSRTVAEFNRHAEQGQDPQFQRGETPYERAAGDAEHAGPNPCVAPLSRAPFYAVRIVPGSLGTFAGVATNAQGQALNAAGQAISGLYAVGNDAASMMGGHYPSGGITLGPAMTFGYLLAQHAARQPPHP